MVNRIYIVAILVIPLPFFKSALILITHSFLSRRISKPDLSSTLHAPFLLKSALGMYLALAIVLGILSQSPYSAAHSVVNGIIIDGK